MMRSSTTHSETQGGADRHWARSSVAVLPLFLVASFAAAAGPFLGEPVLVNNITNNSQSTPAVAGNGAGGTIVAWQCFLDASFVFDICARRFSSVGLPLGGEFRVNQTRVGNQQAPDVAIDDEGVVTVVWESLGQDGAGWGVYARRYGTDGAPLGGEFRVNQKTVDDQRNPSVAAAPNGRVVVVWEAQNQGNALVTIFARRYQDGVAAGSEFQVSSTPTLQQRQPTVAMGFDGRFAVAWRCLMNDASGENVCVQRFGAAGNFRGGEEVVNGTLLGTQDDPEIGMAPDGDFVVVWQSFAQDGDASGVYAQAFRDNGGRRGGERRVNVTTDDSQRQPAVAVHADGSYAVVWQSHNQIPGNAVTVLMRCFHANSAPASGELVAADWGSLPAISVDADGDALVAWQSPGPDIWARAASSLPASDCLGSESALCLTNQRFKVEVAWRKPDGESGHGRGIMLTPDTGYFWFFRASNVEMVLKVLDACSRGNFWVFAGGLTNVEADILITDTVSGERRRYRNELNQKFQPIQDTGAFAACPASASATTPPASPAVTSVALQRLLHDASRSRKQGVLEPLVLRGDGCQPGANRLCLRDRFAVEVDWRKPDGAEGVGTAVPITADTGYFWFFRASNVEMVLKVLDGCNGTGHYWVFAGGLTNVRTTIRVTDTLRDETKIYHNPQGAPFVPIQDTAALASCP